MGDIREFGMEKNLLKRLREGHQLSVKDQLQLIIQLSIPAIMAQITSVIMQYIDASMVGRLGANDSAAIGLVATTTWLISGLTATAGTGFTIQVAHRIGAGDEKGARDVVKHGIVSILLISSILLLVGACISDYLPVWLGGNREIQEGASQYFRIFVLFLPFMQMVYSAGGMLQSSGDMKIPSLLNILMCLLDVIFNWVLIFPSRNIAFGDQSIWVWGAGLGIRGAALGTAFSEVIVGMIMLYFLLIKSKPLHFRRGEKTRVSSEIIKKALKIAIPMGVESVILGGAQVLGTKIVAPLGTIAIAANSFAITAESICFMPGYGIATATTTIVGQSIGAKRESLAKKLGWFSVFFGMTVMLFTGSVMYIFAPEMIGLLTPDEKVRQLGVLVLRIESFAEPLFGAAVVGAGIFRGTGKTIIPTIVNFSSMWLVRLPLAFFLSKTMGLQGVWLAMCLDLSMRGCVFLFLLWKKKL